MDAVTLTRQDLNGKVPLIGFAGAPFTILYYMVQGKVQKIFSGQNILSFTKRCCTSSTSKITDTTAYLNAQIKTGAQAVQLFDSWAGLLAQRFSRFALLHKANCLQHYWCTNHGICQGCVVCNRLGQFRHQCHWCGLGLHHRG